MLVTKEYRLRSGDGQGGGRIRLWRADCRVPPAPITQLAGDHRVPVRGGLPRRLWIVWPVESGGGLARQHRQVRNRNATRLASISFNLLPSPPPFSISDSIGHPYLPSPFPLSFPSPASPPGYLEFAKIHHRPIRLLQLDSSPPMQGSTHAANQRNMQPPYPLPPSPFWLATGVGFLDVRPDPSYQHHQHIPVISGARYWK